METCFLRQRLAQHAASCVSSIDALESSKHLRYDKLLNAVCIRIVAIRHGGLRGPCPWAGNRCCPSWSSWSEECAGSTHTQPGQPSMIGVWSNTGVVIIYYVSCALFKHTYIWCDVMEIGMAHRGRLNVLHNVLGKPLGMICAEMEGTQSSFSVGDVKYHLGTEGASSTLQTRKCIAFCSSQTRLLWCWLL